MILLDLARDYTYILSPSLKLCILLFSLMFFIRKMNIAVRLGVYFWISKNEYQFSSVTQSCLTLCDPMDCSTPGLPVHHQLPEFTQTHVHWVGDAINHLILFRPFSSFHPSFPASGSFQMSQFLIAGGQSIGSFSFSISPSNKYSGLTSSRMDWLDLLAVQRILKSLLQHHSSKI